MKIVLAIALFVAVASAQWSGSVLPIGGVSVQADQTFAGKVGSNNAVAWVSCPTGTCNGSIRYAIGTGTPPNSWVTYSVVSTGLTNVASLAFTNLNGTGVAFAWADRTTAANGNIRYINSANSAGTSFAGIPVRTVSTYANSNNTPGAVSIFTMSGRPAVVWSDQNTALNGGNGATRFQRALDQNGNTWPATTPVEVHNFRNTRVECQLFGVWACAISSPQGGNTVRFVTANNNVGSAWTTQGGFSPQTLSSDGCLTKLASGFPAVGYFSSNGGNALHWIAGTNTAGTTFSASVQAKTGSSYVNIQCAVVNGNPAMAWNTATATSAVQYVRASTATGATATDWNGAITAPAGNYQMLRNGLTNYLTNPMILGRRSGGDIFVSIDGTQLATTVTTVPTTGGTTTTVTPRPSAAGSVSVSVLLLALVMIVAALF